MRSPDLTDAERAALEKLIPRIGRMHLRQRLGLEHDYETRVFRRGTHFLHLENWYSVHSLIRLSLRLSGLHRRGQRNARRIMVREHEVSSPAVPEAFDGFTLLQLSDLHIDRPAGFESALIETVEPLNYDQCVLTGDYRSRTFGVFDGVIDGLRKLRPHLKGTVYAILGNHDTIRLVPPMEEAGYRVLLNEWVVLRRGGGELYLSGVDDPHFYRMDNYHRAGDDIPPHAFSILLAHTPEAYRHAAHAGFDLMLCGHTHGGQICLPGGVPVITDADSPRRLARGAWQYERMAGYTSVGAGTSLVDVRLNCLPEITLHRLRRTPTSPQPSPPRGAEREGPARSAGG